MPREFLRSCSLSATLLIVVAAGATPPRDIARVLPADTLAYVGWAAAPGKEPLDGVALRNHFDALTATGLFETDPGTQAAIQQALRLVPALAKHPTGLALLDPGVATGAPDVPLALLVAAGPQSAELTTTFGELLRTLQAPASASVELGGTVLQATPLGDDGPRLVWGVASDCFLVALGEAAATKVLKGLAGDGPVLAESGEFKLARQKVRAETDGGFFCAFADIRRLLARGRELGTAIAGPPPEFLQNLLAELGIESVKSAYLHAGSTGPRTELFVRLDGPPRGLLAFWQQAPLTDEDLRLIPRDAYWAEVWNLDLPALWAEARRVIEALAPDAAPQVDGGLALANGFLGFSLTDELLPAFGDTWALVDAPAHGGLLLTGTVLVAEVRQREMIERVLTRLLQIVGPLAAQADVNITVREMKHGPHTISYVLVGGQPVPVAPAWCFVGDRWLLGLFPQSVAAAAQQADPATRGPSVLDHPDYAAARALLPSERMAFGYVDSRYLARLWYPVTNMLQTAVVALLSTGPAAADLAPLPLVAEVVADTTSYFGTTSRDADGFRYTLVGSGTGVLTGVAAGSSLATSIALPSLARAREIAKRAVSASNLRQVGMACHSHASDHNNRFPATLDELVQGGVLTAEALRSPRDAGPGPSYVYIAGQTEASDPRNVLAYERIVGDEGTNVLFLDGHVEFMKLPAFEAALRATAERLGRPLEAERIKRK